jgi:hypothetical protein
VETFATFRALPPHQSDVDISYKSRQYDNLFYPYGSPLLCLIDGTPVYPFSGGFLDLLGVMFTLNNGNLVDLWSFGDTAPVFLGPTWPGGLTYGLKVMSPTDVGGYEVLLQNRDRLRRGVVGRSYSFSASV